jgi:hypothetical protein
VTQSQQVRSHLAFDSFAIPTGCTSLFGLAGAVSLVTEPWLAGLLVLAGGVTTGFQWTRHRDDEFNRLKSVALDSLRKEQPGFVCKRFDFGGVAK